MWIVSPDARRQSVARDRRNIRLLTVPRGPPACLRQAPRLILAQVALGPAGFRGFFGLALAGFRAVAGLMLRGRPALTEVTSDDRSGRK